MLTQMQHFELARRNLAAANATFLDMVNCASNPLTREDLAANIERRPALWERYSGWLDVLPSGAVPAIDAACVADPAP